MGSNVEEGWWYRELRLKCDPNGKLEVEPPRLSRVF